ncbi:cupin domain-containing protein [uncultured Psychroserpens sp.]|uniref:cupin domain-containing protein n=1 Tax=uncultured Psychroserpens sp. TaxID=255436 RepID=UPI00261024EF|nr:cupin domain-containing protein [uncultured Psychroserpens sp.]
MYPLQDLIKTLDLQPHPEGGFFKETYRSDGMISKTCLPDVFKSERHYSTGIYYLLESNDFSAFHKINQDEMWHFYLGAPLELTMISDQGVLTMVTIGNDILNDQVLQFVVPKNYWFAAKVSTPNSFSLLGCTVAPGFDFQDFTLASRGSLTAKFPQHRAIIKTLTRQ